MFNLIRTKAEIKKDLMQNYRLLASIMMIPITLLIGYSFIYESLLNLTSDNWELLGMGLLQLLVAPFLLSFTLLGVKYIRSPKFYTSKQFSSIPEISTLDDYKDAVLLTLVVGLYTYLWTLLLIVPGIVKGLSYSQSLLIYFDAKKSGNKLTYNQAITQSRKMMTGHKWNYLLFRFSFIGWGLLAIISLLCAVSLFAFAFNLGFILGIIGFAIATIICISSLILIIYVLFYISFASASYYEALKADN